MPSKMDPEERFSVDTYGPVSEYLRDSRLSIILERDGKTVSYGKMTSRERAKLVEEMTRDGWTVVKLAEDHT